MTKRQGSANEARESHVSHTDGAWALWRLPAWEGPHLARCTTCRPRWCCWSSPAWCACCLIRHLLQCAGHAARVMQQLACPHAPPCGRRPCSLQLRRLQPSSACPGHAAGVPLPGTGHAARPLPGCDLRRIQRCHLWVRSSAPSWPCCACFVLGMPMGSTLHHVVAL